MSAKRHQVEWHPARNGMLGGAWVARDTHTDVVRRRFPVADARNTTAMERERKAAAAFADERNAEAEDARRHGGME